MSLRESARIVEESAGELARKGRGLIGRRARNVERLVGEFVDHAMTVPAGVLPSPVRDELQLRIGHIIDALENYVGRNGARSLGRTKKDSAIVQQIYALREAEQHLLQAHTRFF